MTSSRVYEITPNRVEEIISNWVEEISIEKKTEKRGLPIVNRDSYKRKPLQVDGRLGRPPKRF